MVKTRIKDLEIFGFEIITIFQALKTVKKYTLFSSITKQSLNMNRRSRYSFQLSSMHIYFPGLHWSAEQIQC